MTAPTIQAPHTAFDLPVYRPAVALVETRWFALLHTADSVREVTAGQRARLAAAGWEITPIYEGVTTSTLLADKDGRTVAVNANATGAGSSLSISVW
ncbi:hypothetical protein [Speluncibacter jeojiensis]|uniref:Uncharacterized protein n=1 Tax=Speluncibacter jeojiensis TaxID=2710754 RepID=A0A9X4RF81_9ACTN|nr:hypothetical protein [Corynebacteriales bacterium D3-21]